MAVNSYSLISLENVKNFIGMTGSTSTDDDLLEDLINRVSTLFESYMDRNILTREYTEYHEGKGLSVLFPKQPNITTISGIWDDSDWLWLDVDLLDSDDYKIVDEIYIVFNTTVLGNYNQNIKLMYTAGYTATPPDLTQVCITEVARMYKNRNQIDITAKSLSDGSVSFSDLGFLPLTLITLNKYRGVTVI